jgi:hypothetical protein
MPAHECEVPLTSLRNARASREPLRKPDSPCPFGLREAHTHREAPVRWATTLGDPAREAGPTPRSPNTSKAPRKKTAGVLADASNQSFNGEAGLDKDGAELPSWAWLNG